MKNMKSNKSVTNFERSFSLRLLFKIARHFSCEQKAKDIADKKRKIPKFKVQSDP